MQQKPNLNLVIFDDDEDITTIQQDIKRYTTGNSSHIPNTANFGKSIKHSNSNKQINNNKFNSNQQTQNNQNQVNIIMKQIYELQNKVKNLQKQSQKLKNKTNKYQLNSSNVSKIQSGGQTNNYKQIEQILFVVQKKIQLIIQQSKKLINKITQNVDKNFGTMGIATHKSSNNYSSKQIQSIYKQKLLEIQNQFNKRNLQYQNIFSQKYENFLQQSNKKQQNMLKKLSQIQQKFINKLNAQQKKQKQYIDWIYHLEGKLKEKEKKSKKMITITQEKPQTHPNNFIQGHDNTKINMNVKNNAQNIPLNTINIEKNRNINNDNPKILRQNTSMSIDQHNNSKITRKHKIFTNNNNNNNRQRDNSPIIPNNNIISQTPTKDQILISNKLIDQGNNKTNLGFYNQIKNVAIKNDKTNKSTPSSNTKNEFYQNVPQINSGWDKFADMNQFSNEYNQSQCQSDDFFTPIEPSGNHYNYGNNINGQQYKTVKYQQPNKQQFNEYQQNIFVNKNTKRQNQVNNTNKVFSPFDLN